MKGKGDVAFTAGLGLVGLWMVYRAWNWSFAAKLVPLTMGITFLVLIGLLGVAFALEVRSTRRLRALGASVQVGRRTRMSGRAPAPPPETTSDAPSVRGYVVHGLWFVIFTAAVWVLGFPVGGTLSVAAYLIWARSSWIVVAVLTVSALAFFWAAGNWLQIRFPSPLLW